MQITHTKSGRVIHPRDLLSDLEQLHEQGLQKGVSTGWPGLDEYITLKPGTTFYVYGQPFSGKSEWWFEVLLNTTCLQGWRHAIFSPETGAAHNIMAELISKYLRKPFYRNIKGCITLEELYRAHNELSDKFLIIDAKDDEPLTLDSIFNLVADHEQQFGRIDTITIDPWNELEHDFFERDGGRQDIYLERALGKVRRNAIKYNRINCIITHIANQTLVETDGFRYYPIPNPREIAGGQAYYRKGMNMIAAWRPPAPKQGRMMVNPENGHPFEENELVLDIQKFKPKGVGKRGNYSMFYDLHRNSYSEQRAGQYHYSIRERSILQLTNQSLPNPNEEDLPF